MRRSAGPVFPVSVSALLLFEVTALFARSMLERVLVDGGYERPVARDLSYLVVPPILLVLMLPYIKRCRDPLLSLLKPADFRFRMVVLSILLGLTLRSLFWSTVTLLIWLRPAKEPTLNGVDTPLIEFHCPPLAVVTLSLAVVAILVPVIEEAINRGFILHALLPRGVLASVVVSALLFAALHPPSSYPLAFTIGLFLAVQTLNYQTLWAPMITHATYNATTVLDWDCFRIVWHPAASDPTLQALAVISMPLLIAGGGTACVLVSQKAARACRRPGQL